MTAIHAYTEPIPRPAAPPPSPGGRTLWGLDAAQLHARFWASMGVQVVRQGERSELIDHAELFLLTDARTLPLFRLLGPVERLSWLDADLMTLRLHETRDRGYREFIATDARGRFLQLRRDYSSFDVRGSRVALTPQRDIASVWSAAPSPHEGWRQLRKVVPRAERWAMSIDARVYDRGDDEEARRFMRDLVRTWPRPDATIPGLTQASPGVWAHESVRIERGATFVGPMWIGAGRRVAASTAAVGPSVMWDSPDARPAPGEIRWLDLEPSEPPMDVAVPRRAAGARALKRAFDMAFAALALLVTLPLYPFIMLAIWLEDGRPFFYVHQRETLGGREFGCIKFRSMRRDADRIKQQLTARNKADGPQFYIPDDPRLTRVGGFLRSCQLDEMPQFINVLLGDMSVVGPRPSPRRENQFCPAWREARLSVRPGVTGLWQIKRTRAPGADFQEWIKYDIQYVEAGGLWLDLSIIWKTILLVLRGVTRS